MKELRFFFKVTWVGIFKEIERINKNLILDEKEEEWFSGNGGRIFLTGKEKEAWIMRERDKEGDDETLILRLMCRWYVESYWRASSSLWRRKCLLMRRNQNQWIMKFWEEWRSHCRKPRMSWTEKLRNLGKCLWSIWSWQSWINL